MSRLNGNSNKGPFKTGCGSNNEKQNPGSREYFDDIAYQWDDMRKSFFSESLREKAIQLSGVKAGMTAADIGAGTGFITEGLLKLGIRVIAVDQSDVMLAELKRKFNNSILLECKTGESEDLLLPDASVDRAFANMYLHHTESPQNAIEEMARILKPGGRLVITDLDEHNFEFLRAEQFDRWMGFKRENVSKWLEFAGLKDVSVECANEKCCADSSCGCETARISIFIATGVHE